MKDLLKFEADMMTIQIIANSLSFRDLSDAKGREVERKKYISRVGYLYPERDDALSRVNDFKAMLVALEASPYEEMLRKVNQDGMGDKNEAENSGVSIDDVMLIESSKRMSLAFEDSFSYGAFYAYLRLKEQEIKNITWLAELMSMSVSKDLPGWNKFVPPFKYHGDEIVKE